MWQLFFGEEPCISGRLHNDSFLLRNKQNKSHPAVYGSGAVFFSHCNLRCVFCQNYQISQLNQGKIYSDAGLREIFYKLAKRGAKNINLISPTCYHKRLVKILRQLKAEKFPLPIIWNSNAYEREENIQQLRGLVDVYLPDFKYGDNKLALKFSAAAHYLEIAEKAIAEMAKQQPNARFKQGFIQKGLIIRHLILPNHLENSKIVIRDIKRILGNQVWLSLMSQYTPVYKAGNFPSISRTLEKNEYDEIVQYALSLGFENIYIQELSSIGTNFIPNFSRPK